MQKIYREEHEGCNVIGAQPSLWSWYEHFHNILGVNIENEWCNWWP